MKTGRNTPWVLVGLLGFAVVGGALANAVRPARAPVTAGEVDPEGASRAAPERARRIQPTPLRAPTVLVA